MLDAGYIDALWSAVVAEPDDLAARMVLGDALIANGDPRGQLFALQARSHGKLRGDDRLRILIRRHWRTWLGELAPALVRGECVWQRGLLVRVRVGQRTAPDSAYAASRGHRELCALDTVSTRGGHPGCLATFLDGLPRTPRTLVALGHQIFDELALRRQTLASQALVYELTWGTSVRTFERIGQAMAALEQIELVAPRLAIPAILAEAPRIARALPQLFPALRRIRIGTWAVAMARAADDDATADWLAHSPLVELYDSCVAARS